MATTTTIQLRRGLSTAFTPVTLANGEPAFLTDTHKLYIGNAGDKILINPTYGTAANADLGVAAGNVPVLDANGKLPDSVLSSLAITDVFVISTEVEMLGLDAQVGDVAIRTDLSKSFILRKSPATLLSNWTELLSGASVTSVNGKTGVVVLSGADILSTGYVAGSAAPIAATDTIIAALAKLEAVSSTKAPLISPSFTGVPLAPTAVPGTSTTQIATTAFVKEALLVVDGGTF